MCDSGLGLGLVDAGSGPLLRLLANIYEFVVTIEDLKFECHPYPFVLKSSFFKNSIQDFKNSAFKVAGSEHKNFLREERPIPEFRLVLPGGSHTFELIRNFCYDSSVPITKENVLSLLVASNLLGFTEDVAPGNLLSRCQRFIEEESKNHGIQGILSMLAHSTIDDATGCDLLINKLAEQALALQNFDNHENTREIVELLLELLKLHPKIVEATLQEFGRLGVNMVDFFWCRELPTNLDVLLGCDKDSQTNGRSIYSYFSQALDKCIAAGEVQIDRVDPKKLVMLLNPGVFTCPMLSDDVVKAYVSSKLSQLEAEDVLDLHPRVVKDLVLTAVSASSNNIFRGEDIQHLAGLIDRVLLFEAKRNPWDGSTDAKENFKEIAECVPLKERLSHDLLYDAVQNFSQLFPDTAEDIWKMVDMDKLSESKVEAAIAFTLSRYDNRFVRLLRRKQDNAAWLLTENLYLKRKLPDLEEDESKRKSRSMIPDHCGTLFTVFVRSLDGSLSSLLVDSNATVDIIREAIARSELNFQSDRFWWPVFQGKKLLESDTIASYGIEKDCTLYIKVSLLNEAEKKFLGWSHTSQGDDVSTSSHCVCGCK